MNYITFEDAKTIISEKIKSSILGIRSYYDFEWGTVFIIQSKEYINTRKNPIAGLSPVLVDKFDKSIHSICTKYKTLDQELEKYRVSKNYPHVIKFPVKGDINQMTDLEKVFALMETSEIVQIERAISIVKQRKLFDLEGFGKLFHKYRFDSLEEAIARCFHGIGKKHEYVLYNSELKVLPKEINLFAENITSLYIGCSKLEEIPSHILGLYNLKSIYVEGTPLRKIHFDLSTLINLESIEFFKTGIKPNQKNFFILPQGCKLKIT